MLVEPADLSPDVVLDLVREYWDDRAAAAAYLPRGAGAHHWGVARSRGPRWFVTADDVTVPGRLDELQDAYVAARRLALDGHHLVLPTVPPLEVAAGSGPVPGAGGAVGVVTGHWLVTVTPYLEGEAGPGDYADDNQRALLARGLGELHAAVPPPRARLWEPGPPMRDELEAILASDLDGAWDSGPFGDDTRAVLQEKRTGLLALLERYDALAAHALDDRGGWVVTHGEPHTANVLWSAGGPRLVDWESLRVSPRERDLRWVLRDADGAEPLSAYLATAGLDLATSGIADDLDDMVELFDLEWTLWQVGQYAVRFAGEHSGDDDDRRFHRALLAELADLP